MRPDRSAAPDGGLKESGRQGQEEQSEIAQFQGAFDSRTHAFSAALPADRIERRRQARSQGSRVVAERKTPHDPAGQSRAVQQVPEPLGSEIDQVARHVEAIPARAEDPRLARGHIGDLQDQAAARLEHGPGAAQRGAWIGEMFQHMKHGDEIEGASLPGIARDIPLPDRQVVLPPCRLHRLRRHIDAVGKETAPPRQMQEGPAAAADVKQGPSGAGGMPFQEPYVIHRHKLAIGAFQPAQKTREA